MFTGHSHELGSKSSPEDSVGAALQPINHPGCPRTSTRVTDQCRVRCFHSRAPKEGLTSDRSSPAVGQFGSFGLVPQGLQASSSGVDDGSVAEPNEAGSGGMTSEPPPSMSKWPVSSSENAS